MTMDYNINLQDKTVLVTGASSGIGREIAIACSAAGAKVILMARNEERLAETNQACHGDGHVTCSIDLSDLDSIPKIIRNLCKEHGPLSGLVHSAGVHQLKPLRALRAKDIESMFSLNSVAGVMLAKGLAMKGNFTPNASVVLLSSVMGQLGQPGAIAYCMSKGAIEGAVKAMALELAPEKIRVNGIAPAMIDTPMTQKAFNLLGPELTEGIKKMHPWGLGQPQNVADAAIFLLSNASSYITGTSLLVDGGYSAQ